MNYAEICIIKRDGKREDFSISKIKNAIGKAFHATGINNEEKLIADITMRIISNFTSSTISVEEIQDLVENELMKVRPEVAKKYIIYREWRNTERDRKTQMKHIMDGIVAIDKNDVNLSNANMSSHTPAGQMMTFASEVTKDYTYKYLLPKKFAEAHQLGDIHIHDLDYYPTKTTTCIQYDLDDLFERGFRTKNGSIRTPQSIQSYATLATIIFQTNQNEQHGGQAIPAFDFFMAKGVRKTHLKHLQTLTDFYREVEGKEPNEDALKKIEEKVLAMTRKDTHQAMEGFIHNLNTMHSRGGNQVVFSSINYGTDTSAEGRMVIEELLKATIEGLGSRGEVPVFPIQIFKIKDGVSYSEEDYKKAIHAVMEKTVIGEDEMLVLMGHGTDHHANSAYPTLEYTFHSLGYQQVLVGTVESFPDLRNVMAKLEISGRKKVVLMPFMFVAGDHAKNDMAGEEDSWKSELEEKGYEVRVILKGLGEFEGIRKIFAEHIEEAEM